MIQVLSQYKSQSTVQHAKRGKEIKTSKPAIEKFLIH